MPTNQPKGIINWQGASQLDQQPIILITTGFETNRNRKTGNQPQTWILRSDIDPVTAVQQGKDYSICGNCPRRGKQGKGRTCFVLPFQAPGRIYNYLQTKGYSLFQSEDLERYKYKSLRLGSYGDPSAVPVLVWYLLLSVVAYHTGFTRQWMSKVGQKLRGICQASCNNIEEAQQAAKLNWKVYLSLPVGSPAPTKDMTGLDFIECPYQESNGRVTCSSCNLCNGSTCHVWVYDHGAKWKQRQVES